MPTITPEKLPKAKRTVWKNIPGLETLELSLHGGRSMLLARNVSGHYHPISQMGRSSFKVDCGFCGQPHRVYGWSLAGCGKRCERCNSLITWGHTMAVIDETIPSTLLEKFQTP